MPAIIHNFNGTYIEHVEQYINTQYHTAQKDHVNPESEAEDVTPVETSFFCTERYDLALCEKNLREAIEQAKSKADACRKIMLLETCGYIRLSNVSDERKAELINPFAEGKYEFTAEDFKKSRNRPTN